MRFPVSFIRNGPGGAAPLLGSDGAAGTPPTGAPQNGKDNILSIKGYSNQGWPAHRIAVGYKTVSGGPAIGLVAQIWFWDSNSQAWYEVGAPQTITPNRLTYFDCVVLLDNQASAADVTPSNSSINAQLVIQVGAQPAGVYGFSMGADCTVLPL